MLRSSVMVILIASLLCAGCSGLSEKRVQSGTVDEKYIQEAAAMAYAAEAQIRQAYPLLDDPELTLRMQRMTTRIQTYAKRPYVHSQIYIIAAPGYANSCTGGKDIFIGKTLLDMLPHDDARASVIAHEIAHIDYFHGLRTQKHADKMHWVTFGLNQSMNIGLSFIPGAGAVPALGTVAPQAIGLMNSVTSDIVHKGYSRAFEYEADEASLQLMASAGYNPLRAPDALETLSAYSKQKKTPTGIMLFSTHPIPDKRIARMKQILVEQPSLRAQPH